MEHNTDEKLHDELIKNGYKQSTSDPSSYWQPNGTGGYNEVDTDGSYVKKSGTDDWKKYKSLINIEGRGQGGHPVRI